MIEVLYWIFVFIGIWFFILETITFIFKRVSWYLVKRFIKSITTPREALNERK